MRILSIDFVMKHKEWLRRFGGAKPTDAKGALAILRHRYKV
ncbi:MAG: hypothetical protein ABXS91_02680 [Sulfurimonas sp.]